MAFARYRRLPREKHVGDLFEMFLDLPRPFHAHPPRWVALQHLQRVKAQAAFARAQAASIIGRYRMESDRRVRTCAGRSGDRHAAPAVRVQERRPHFIREAC
jgi:hypothetical protein